MGIPGPSGVQNLGVRGAGTGAHSLPGSHQGPSLGFQVHFLLWLSLHWALRAEFTKTPGCLQGGGLSELPKGHQAASHTVISVLMDAVSTMFYMSEAQCGIY